MARRSLENRQGNNNIALQFATDATETPQSLHSFVRRRLPILAALNAYQFTLPRLYYFNYIFMSSDCAVCVKGI